MSDTTASTTTSENNPLFGRKWKITVYLSDGGVLVLSDSSSTPIGSALRTTFSIERPGYQACYYGDINVYNLNGATESTIIEEGNRVTVEAGYLDGYYGKIFDGKVFQVFRQRENVIDYKLTLHCIDGMGIYDGNLVNFTIQPGSDQRGHLQIIANQAKNPFQLGVVTDNLSTTKLPRGKTFFGSPESYLRPIAQSNNAQLYIYDNAVHMTRVVDGTVVQANQAIKVAPETGLIGSPQVTSNGVQFKVLLNPLIKIVNPSMLIYLEPTSVSIKQQLAQIGQYFTILDNAGYYQVGSLHHIGDTRGNDWYTEVTGINSNGVLPFMVATAQTATN